MSAPIDNCPAPCCTTPPSVNVPGPAGNNAYTTIAAPGFTLPAVSANVTVPVTFSGWMVVGQFLFCAGPANFQVVSIGSSTSVVLKFLGLTGDLSAGVAVAAGVGLTPAAISLASQLPLLIAQGGTGAATKAAAALALGVGQNPTSNYGSGTTYTFTATPALLDFGTTDPITTIAAAGTYLLMGRAAIQLSQVTYAAPHLITLKLRRTNNTAADITNATTSYYVPIGTTYSQGQIVSLPAVLYTATAGDVIQVWGSVQTLPDNAPTGIVYASEASIIAVPLYLT